MSDRGLYFVSCAEVALKTNPFCLLLNKLAMSIPAHTHKYTDTHAHLITHTPRPVSKVDRI